MRQQTNFGETGNTLISMQRQEMFSEEEFRVARYIFIDIVGYSLYHSETQREIIRSLTTCVLAAIRGDKFQIDSNELMFLPTGDGYCIALLGDRGDPAMIFDLAMRILELIYVETESREDKYKVRIGINESRDVMYTDITGKRNISGAGINMAQRIMDLGDANTILASESVVRPLNRRNWFKLFEGVDKHGNQFPVYQFVGKDEESLQISKRYFYNKPPSKLRSRSNDYIASFLALFTGSLGLHRIYKGQWWGILYPYLFPLSILLSVWESILMLIDRDRRTRNRGYRRQFDFYLLGVVCVMTSAYFWWPIVIERLPYLKALFYSITQTFSHSFIS